MSSTLITVAGTTIFGAQSCLATAGLPCAFAAALGELPGAPPFDPAAPPFDPAAGAPAALPVPEAAAAVEAAASAAAFFPMIEK